MTRWTPTLFPAGRTPGKKGTTLVEALVALFAAGVIISVTAAVFVPGWSAYEKSLARARLWHEANEITETVALDGREARQIDVTEEEDTRSAVFTGPEGNILAVYRLQRDGTLLLSRDSGQRVLSDHCDFDASDWTKMNKALRVHIVLKENLWNGPTAVTAETEIYPRN
jgi:hypothetical protein